MTYERQRVPSITNLDYSPITGVSSPMCNTNIIDRPAWRHFKTFTAESNTDVSIATRH